MPPSEYTPVFRIESAKDEELCRLRAGTKYDLSLFIGDSDEEDAELAALDKKLAEVNAEADAIERRDTSHPAIRKLNRLRDALDTATMIAEAAGVVLPESVKRTLGKGRQDEQTQEELVHDPPRDLKTELQNAEQCVSQLEARPAGLRAKARESDMVSSQLESLGGEASAQAAATLTESVQPLLAAIGGEAQLPALTKVVKDAGGLQALQALVARTTSASP
ncbi:hypothetical protein BKA63DRAFT_561529 [Paraphoma chrysanthemicola]|nr:hypothetical protein BKA63DRAFT_561529 [Paraphoma chrysanthemicola]